MTQTNSRVLRLPRNTAGRVFILGDIHGAYDLVWQGMKAVNFNMECDWLLSNGDLIDRGAGSRRVKKFLGQPYVRAVAGNHDRMLADLWKKGELTRDLVDALAHMNFNGMRWMKDVPLSELEDIAAALDELPFVIEMETERGLVGMVHADVPQGMDWQTFVAKIEAGDEYATRMALGMDVSDEYHESRQRVEQRRTDGVRGIGRVFVGHTVLKEGMQQLGNVYAIDTGAVFGEAGKGFGHLTMVNPLMATVELNKPQPLANPLLDLRYIGEVPQRPFTAIEAIEHVESETPRP